MAERRIFIVQSSEGEYEDYHERNERAFANRASAEAYARELDRVHHPERIIDEDLWDEAEGEWFMTHEEVGSEHYETNPYNYQTQRTLYDEWMKAFENRHHQFLLDYINAHSQRQFTMSDVLQQEQNDFYADYDWYPCTVEELVLEE